MRPLRSRLAALALAAASLACASADDSVARFREYLRIRTEQPTPDYEKAAKFLVKQAKEIGCAAHVFAHWPRVLTHHAGLMLSCCAMRRTSRSCS